MKVGVPLRMADNFFGHCLEAKISGIVCWSSKSEGTALNWHSPRSLHCSLHVCFGCFDAWFCSRSVGRGKRSTVLPYHTKMFG